MQLGYSILIIDANVQLMLLVGYHSTDSLWNHIHNHLGVLIKFKMIRIIDVWKKLSVKKENDSLKPFY